MAETRTQELIFSKAVNQAIRQEMARDPSIVVIGEDVAGAAGRAHLGLVDAWGGPTRSMAGLVTAFGRELDLWLEAESRDHATVGRRQLVVDAEARSVARFRREEDACPSELELHLVLHEVHTLFERSDEHERARTAAGGRETTTLGRVTLITRQVSSQPEIFDLDQRGVRLPAQHRAVLE